MTENSVEDTTLYREILQAEDLTAPSPGEGPRKLDQSHHGTDVNGVVQSSPCRLLVLGTVILSAAFLFGVMPIKMPFGHDVWTDGNSTFPGMDDNVTCLENCSPRIIADLYQARHLPPDQQPFSTFLYQDDWNRTYTMESTEPYPHGCPVYKDCMTFPEYMRTCTTTGKNYMTGFKFYTDWSQVDSMGWYDDKCDIDSSVIKTIPLIDGTWTGYVHKADDSERLFISVPDISNSCWYLVCWDDKCVESVQKNLRRVSLNDFVMAIKDVWCE